MTRPNVVCFVLDQLRYDHLGYAGNSVVETPNIDALAERGVALSRAYVANPLCMPARASLFTGLMPRDHGVRTNGIPLDPSLPTLPGALREAGYRTHAAGKLHLHTYDLPNGAGVVEVADGQADDGDGVDGGSAATGAAGGQSAVADAVAPEEFPEARPPWNENRHRALPEPYYGFETADFTGGHVSWIFGEYRQWLEREHPEAAARLDEDHPDNEPRPAPQTFEWSLPEELHYNRWIADRSREFVESATGMDEPFFLLSSFPDPHHPFAAPEPWGSMYDPDDVALPTRREGELDDLPPFYREAYADTDTQLSGFHGTSDLSDDQLREQIAVTYGMISFVDREIGRVLAALDEAGLREETLVVFMSDHGDMMGDHWMLRKGPFHFEGLLRVPMLWSFPGTLPAGERRDGPVSAVDFAPTVLDFCDIPVPEGRVPPEREAMREPPAWAGRSLRPQLSGETDAVRDGVVVENDEDYLGLRVRTYVTDRYKLTLYPGEPYGELFDLRKDPDELRNRWDDEAYADVRRRLSVEFLERYVLHEQGLPRRLCHA
ncbi:sulfatase family protein [Haloprofundus halobius]|uniref:sulfatase family protein n=1 Tax=Haloprofundus halobius TaxID=2876194 RepID=UPI001CCA9B86|nr:sulfatase-like hydrolase/transferase [Haloprofundus halobius]